ncbi:Structural maintenance of chromosomes protein 2 [Boothiomyces macroporosus]|uniref:Structural maintenance of chromosomes protein n=1 Tax=Boothiomyces macroporosus TaxID=261099 RepID=A0AAD5Y4V2_9FUNG|nr:Structural maintenance of chromosomes protein 2 [Boothiomyces macroporosus]
MHIDEIILEGFKSYATRTVIGKWDPRFNAITGLNGTGKSNILDSICFVLGITSYQHKGQAGINKASVTIIFDNSNRERSPPGYESEKTITYIIGGKNKYLINGKTQTQQNVTEMFQSVQLNIQNPNFLIMQGKITQVLNMKPAQILGMIEEAAGTRLYEDRKDKALKAIEKKESKLAQSSLLLDTEIAPKLDEYQVKKREYLEFQKIRSEREKFEKVIVASDYVKYTNLVEKFDEKKQQSAERISHLEKTEKMLHEEIKEAQERIEEVTAERSKNGGVFYKLEDKFKETGNEIAKYRTQIGLKTNAIKDEMDEIKALNTSLDETKANLEAAKEHTSDLERECDAKLKEYDTLKKSIKDVESLVVTLTTGLSSSDGKDNGYMDQLAGKILLITAAKQENSTAASEIQQNKVKLSHLQNEIKAKEPKAREAKKENAALLAEVQKSKNILENLESELKAIDINLEAEGELISRKKKLAHSLQDVQQKIDDMERTMNGVKFNYIDPTPNFDRSKVKGLVVSLVSIPEEHLDKSTALEVSAGGKLYQVVVEDEKVATQLLQNGKLQKRVTIIPLNKIHANKAPAEKVQAAKKLAPGKVDLALNLIGEDKEIAQALNYIFGSTLVCNGTKILILDSNTAKRVTFDKNVNLKSVTIDGDSYDPSGQLTGGSRSQSSGILLKMQSLKKLYNEQRLIAKHLDVATEELDDFLTKKQLWDSMNKKKELKHHELNLAQTRMENNPHFKIIQQVDDLIEQHKAAKDAIEAAKLKQEKSSLRIKEIEKEMEELTNNRDSKLKSLQNQIKADKKKLSQMEPDVEKMKQAINISKEESLQFEAEIVKINESINTAKENIEKVKIEQNELEAKVKKLDDYMIGMSTELQEERKALAKYDKELQSLEKALVSKNQQIEDNKLELQQIKSQLQSMTEDLSKSKSYIKKLEKEYQWIKDQKQLFGVEGTQYNFKEYNISELETKIKHLSASEDKLKRNVDPTVIDKYDKVEKNATSLKNKLTRVKKDKTSIQSTLEYLDRKKHDKLLKTWEKVNKDFGDIFGDLLPGNTCKLEPPEGDISEGLEVRVCLGGVWKSSLTELSGGQRSLIALSLILALLQFNPAPMYILDEVDAALDLSHTQNIGKLLKSRFRTSQFILVSLKDGMYNNANVLFRTKFVDGVSQVERKEHSRLKQSPVKNVALERAKSAHVL